MTIGSVLVDFDGTACPVDVTGELCAHFAAGNWEACDDAVRRQGITPRSAIDQQTAMLSAGRAEMLRFVLGSFSVSPSFVTTVRWAESQGLPVAVVSDGFGFYIEPMLAAVGLDRVRVLANRLAGSPPSRLAHPYAHPECLGCGTCKMLSPSSTTAVASDRSHSSARANRTASQPTTPTSSSPSSDSLRSARTRASTSSRGRRSPTSSKPLQRPASKRRARRRECARGGVRTRTSTSRHT